MEPAAYEALLAEKKPSIFARNLASVVFGPEILVNRCFDTKSRILDKKVTARSPRSRVEPERIALIRG